MTPPGPERGAPEGIPSSIEEMRSHLAEIAVQLPSDASKRMFLEVTSGFMQQFGALSAYETVAGIPGPTPPELTYLQDGVRSEMRIASERIGVAKAIAQGYSEALDRVGLAGVSETLKETVEAFIQDCPEHADWLEKFADSLFKD